MRTALVILLVIVGCAGGDDDESETGEPVRPMISCGPSGVCLLCDAEVGDVLLDYYAEQYNGGSIEVTCAQTNENGMLKEMVTHPRTDMARMCQVGRYTFTYEAGNKVTAVDLDGKRTTLLCSQ